MDKVWEEWADGNGWFDREVEQEGVNSPCLFLSVAPLDCNFETR